MDLSSAHSRPLRICVTGAECTGKSALATALGEALEAPVIQEAAREYFERKANAGDPSVFAADLVRIAELQVAAEDRAPCDVPIVVLDTDVLSLAIWQTRYFGDRNVALHRLARERQADDATRVDLYVLCAPDIPFVHDCVRGSREERPRMHEVFRERLVAEQRTVVEVSGPLDERLQRALDAVADVAGARSPAARAASGASPY